MDGEKEIKSFIGSIKNAIMSPSVETLKEDSLQGVLNSFRDVSSAGDISKYFGVPEFIKVYVDRTSKPFSCNIIDEKFKNTLAIFNWGLRIKDSSIATYFEKTSSNLTPYEFTVKGLKVGETKLIISFTYNKKDNLSISASETIKFTVTISVH